MIAMREPWVLFALVLVPVIWWAWLSRRRRAALQFSEVSRLRAAGQSWSLRARHVLPVLRSLAVILLVVSIARPQKADEETRVTTEGIAIQLVVDRSGSMSEHDFVVDEEGNTQTRLEAVKDVVEAFVMGDGDKLRGRPDDLIGLIAFGTFADTECPLTHDHKHLTRSLRQIEPYTRREDQWQGQTAIGDALLLAVERIRNIKRRFESNDTFTIKSQIIILLTDGEQNAGKYKPEEAAEVAKALGVKVYTIGAAPEFQIRQMGGLLFPAQKYKVPVSVDEESLQKVAETTGGKYFRAKDTNSLSEIYTEIDRLERSAVDEKKYYQYQELAYTWLTLGPVKLPPPLMVVLGLLAIEVVLANTRFRRIP
ncbi:MAG: VWA domain-containing protein [Phycisphaerae bacterium]|nr:VWA domain-containing protein [Phycisphaerae bacterium]